LPLGTTGEPVTPTRGGGLVRVRLDLGYDGSAFSGWATQPGLRTVQGVVEDALATLLRLEPPPRLTVSGRTDAGVHARGQVAHVDVPLDALTRLLDQGRQRGKGQLAAIDGEAGAKAAARERVVPRVAAELLTRLRGVLPYDVRVVAVSEAPDGFDARFSPLSRRYAYRLTDDPTGVDPLRRLDVVAYPRPLDADAMHAAAQVFVGKHDFVAFCRRRQGATTVRRLLRLDCARDGDGIITADVEADAFCHSMVRALIGCLIGVGEGRKPKTWPRDVLAKAARDSDVQVAPAHGLTLEEVTFPADHELGARADETRRTRAPLGS
jgi:tRNA pseudouridine38-40 synthase